MSEVRDASETETGAGFVASEELRALKAAAFGGGAKADVVKDRFWGRRHRDSVASATARFSRVG